MRLSTLLKVIAPKSVNGLCPVQTPSCAKNRHPAAGERAFDLTDPEIGSIHYRAQEVIAGGLFIAVPGLTADGHDFIDEALQRGAIAIVSQKPVVGDALVIEVDHTRKALAAIADCFYHSPSANLCIIGITGTNGKTTTAYLIEGILQQAGYRVGIIGTINYHYRGQTFANPMTTPEAPDLQRILEEMRRAGVTHVVMEVSSHAVDLCRVAKCQFDIGVFTNLSQDHLDFHQTMDRYWSCKKRFFTEHLSLSPKKDKAQAVINREDEKGRQLQQALHIPTTTVGQAADDHIRPLAASFDISGIKGKIATPAGTFEFNSALVGSHNLENILCSTGVAVALGLAPHIIKAGIEQVKAIPGRLERISSQTGKYVYVDYAHTPDALAHALSALKSLTTNRLICVFGCGGNRDRGKRPQMGSIAGKLCDLAIVTSDNPRKEAPMDIIAQVVEGTRRFSPHAYDAGRLTVEFETKGHVIEADRRQAIRLGVAVARPGDVLLIAGKGHETYQILGDRTIAFDDREEARKALEGA